MTEQSHVEEQAVETNEGFNLKRGPSGMIYFNVFDGTLCQKTKEARDGWEGPIKTINPQDKSDVFTYVMRYDSLVGRIIDVNKYKKEFDNGGKTSGFNITIMAGSKRGILQLTWIEHTLKRFLKVAPNIDFEKPIRISVWPTKTAKGKTKAAVSFKQGDDPDPENWVSIPEFYNKENEDMPKAIYDEDNDEWDDKAQNRFLGERFAADTLPKIKEIAARYPAYQAPAAPPQTYPPQQTHSQAQVEQHLDKTKPDNPVAKSLADLVTAKQLGMIRAMSREKGLDAESLCRQELECATDELSKRAASYFIDFIQNVKDERPAPAPAPAPVAQPQLAQAAPAKSNLQQARESFKSNPVLQEPEGFMERDTGPTPPPAHHPFDNPDDDIPF